MTESNRLPIIAISAVALCAIVATVWVGTSVRGLRSELEASRKASDTGTATIIGNLGLIQGELAMIRKNPLDKPPINVVPDGNSQVESVAEPVLPLKTYAEAAILFEKMEKSRTAAIWASTIAELDGWLMASPEQDALQTQLAKLIPHLRVLVNQEVTALQRQALTVVPSSKGAKTLDEAGRILALYPISDDPAAIAEAGVLADRQMDSAARLDALRRQRYNRWAINQIGLALNYYNGNVSKWNPLNDNTALLPPLVKSLGPVDPMFLEPAVLELYNYIIDKMKGSLSEANKLEFAKLLTDPTISRVSLGER